MTQSEALGRDIEAPPDVGGAVRSSGEWSPTDVEALRREIARLRAAKEEAVSAQQRLTFLCEASRELAASLDRATTLETIARITVPVMGDLCVVLVVGELGGRLEIGAVRAKPSNERILQQLLQTYLATPIVALSARGEGAPESPVVMALRTGAPILVPNVTDAYLRSVASSAEELRLARELTMSSFLIVPLKVRDRVLGVMGIATTRCREPYSNDDVKLAEELARRGASALENALLLRAEQRAREAAERAVEESMKLQREIEAKRARLEASEERYRLAERASNAYLYVVNCAAREITYSDGLTRFFAWDPSVVPIAYEPSLAWWGEKIHPLERDRVLADFREAVAGSGEAWVREYRFRKGDGRYAWVLDRAAIARNERGEATQVVGSVMDISDRMRAFETQRRLAALVEASQEGILSIRADGTIESWNKGAARIFGYSAEEIVGRSVLVLTPPDREGEARGIHERCSRGASISGLETVRRTKCGKDIEISLSIAPTSDAAGNFVGMSALYQDITERKRLRAQLALADRTASLGTLAAGVAHEVNNPIAYVIANLTRIASGLERLRCAAIQPELSQALASLSQAALDAKDGASRIAQIIRGLQILSRGDEDTRRPVDLRSIVDIAVKMAGAQAHGRARIVKEYGEVPLVDGNEALLVQVFINLVVNAAHAIPEGAADRQEIRVVTRTDEGGRAFAEVRDTGAGIPPEIRERIFEPFFTTKPVGVGTGIGLAICRGIVSAHGGAITVESEMGKGSVFRITLPALSPRSVQAEARAEPSAGRSARRGRLLVIDDEVKLGKAIALDLSLEHDAHLETSGEEALARFRRGERFDVILCDLFMPSMPGMVLYEEVRRIDPGQADRMIFLTGGAYTAGARKFLSDITNQSLEKPFDMDRLRALVREVLGEPLSPAAPPP